LLLVEYIAILHHRFVRRGDYCRVNRAGPILFFADDLVHPLPCFHRDWTSPYIDEVGTRSFAESWSGERENAAGQIGLLARIFAHRSPAPG
jgi:hypothetical protein